MMYMDDRPLGKNEFLKKCQKTEADKYSLFKKKKTFFPSRKPKPSANSDIAWMTVFHKVKNKLQSAQ